MAKQVSRCNKLFLSESILNFTFYHPKGNYKFCLQCSKLMLGFPMKILRLSLTTSFCALIFFLNSLQAQDSQPTNLLPEGAFATPETIVNLGSGKDGAWGISPGDHTARGSKVEILNEDGLKIARLFCAPSDSHLTIRIILPVDATKDTFTVSGRIRIKDLVKSTLPGTPEWASAQFLIAYADAEGKYLGQSLIYRSIANTEGWIEFEKKVIPLAGATTMEIQTGLFSHSGTFDLADVKVFATSQTAAP